jgi:hypothetical protein
VTTSPATPPQRSSFYTRLLVRVLLFGAIGLVVWLLVGLVVDGSVFDNPFWGVVAGIFVAVITMGMSRRR